MTTQRRKERKGANERPILFSGEMVRAILDGRKTQTRRIVKVPWLGEGMERGKRTRSPFGGIGDRLWVKETFRLSTADDCACYDSCLCRIGVPIYRATCGFEREENDPPWKPSIFMPRKASRITLEITDVRVERLQEISADDCKAEGLVHGARAMWGCPGTEEIFDEGYKGYRWLWESINGEGSWAKNPWVWVVGFKRVGGEPGGGTPAATGRGR